jgi:hypothetical protein
MARTLTSGQITAVGAKEVIAAMFLQLDFVTPLRLSNLGFAYDWGGYTWQGLGDLGAIAPIYETASIEVKGVVLTLSGVPNELIATALAEDYQGKRCQVWYAVMNSDGTLINSPVRVFFGRVDTMSIESGEDGSTISVTAEPPNVDWQRARGGRFNNEDQQTRYPGDLGLEHVDEMVEVEILWGKG